MSVILLAGDSLQTNYLHSSTGVGPDWISFTDWTVRDPYCQKFQRQHFLSSWDYATPSSYVYVSLLRSEGMNCSSCFCTRMFLSKCSLLIGWRMWQNYFRVRWQWTTQRWRCSNVVERVPEGSGTLTNRLLHIQPASTTMLLQPRPTWKHAPPSCSLHHAPP